MHLFTKRALFAALLPMVGSLFLAATASAQTPTDGIMMGRGQVCAAVMAGQDEWDHYWEGKLKRDNPNIGTITSKMVMPMVAFGATKRLNLIASLPWISNKASAGTLKPEKGLQDFSFFAKWRPLVMDLGPGSLNFIATGGLSSPVRKYKADYLPLCVGLGAKTASVRGLWQYYMNTGLFGNVQAGFTSRANSTIDRTFYYVGDTPYYTNDVEMPGMFDYGASIGYYKDRFLKVQLNYTYMDTRSNSDIRRNDMPFISNNMDAERVGGVVQYWVPKTGGLSVILMGAYTLSGRNVGQATSLGGGLAYQFGAYKNKEMAEPSKPAPMPKKK